MTYKFGTPSSPVGTVTDVAGTQSTDASTGIVFSVALNAIGTNTIENPTNLQEGQVYSWQLKQDASTPVDVDFDDNFYFSGGLAPTITQVPGAVDILRATALADGAGNTKLYSAFEANVGEVLPCYNGSWVLGKIGNYALDFDGVNNHVLFGAANSTACNALQPSAGTYACWILPDVTGGFRGIVQAGPPTGTSGSNVDYGPNMYIHSAGSGKLYVNIGSGAQYAYKIGNPDIGSGSWVHLAMTWTAAYNSTDDLKLYQNGVELSSDLYANGNSTPSGWNPTNQKTIRRFLLGSNPQATQYFYDGKMDEVAVWDQALTGGEITSLYNLGSGVAANTIQSSAIVAYYSFEQGPGSATLTDNGSNGYAGTLTNMTPGTPC